MSKVKINYNNELFNEYFYLDSNSPSGLRYLKDNEGLNWTKRYKHDVAGYVRFNKKTNIKIWVVKIDGVAYVVHRIIWYLIHGKIDSSFVIDHVDGNSLNNTIENLRLVTQEINNKNHQKQKNNISGFTGVFFEEDKNGRGRFKASWNENGKQKSKSFSLNKYKNAFELAVLYRNQKIQELEEYTERHGM